MIKKEEALDNKRVWKPLFGNRVARPVLRNEMIAIYDMLEMCPIDSCVVDTVISFEGELALRVKRLKSYGPDGMNLHDYFFFKPIIISEREIFMMDGLLRRGKLWLAVHIMETLKGR
ncbi:MAG: hypothetical protein ABIP54_02005 [Candidatus Andersenbacteria bacterium]